MVGSRQQLLELPGRRIQRAVMVVDEANGTGGDDLLQMQLDDLAAFQRIFGHGFRHKGEAQLAFDQREHLVGGGGLGVGLQQRVMLQEELPVKAPGHALVTQGDEGIIAQFFQSQVLACQCGERLAAHQHLVKRFQFHHFQAGLDFRRGRNDRKIHLTVFHGLHGLRGGVV